MHAIHHTRAVILKSQPSKESDRLVWLFTEDFGLVVAVATGIRKPGAKLASQLIEYSFIDVDLVKGREVWRLVSATPLSAPLAGNTTHPLARPYIRMLATLERFLIDEGTHGELFVDIYDASKLIGGPYHEQKRFDTLIIWRILVALGYIAVESSMMELVHAPFADALEMLDESLTKQMISTVNSTIKETHL